MQLIRQRFYFYFLIICHINETLISALLFIHLHLGTSVVHREMGEGDSHFTVIVCVRIFPKVLSCFFLPDIYLDKPNAKLQCCGILLIPSETPFHL
jgi:hypothetical protein